MTVVAPFAPSLFDAERTVRRIDPGTAARYVVAHHYMHRAPTISHAFGLVDGDLLGVCTFGIPASRHLQMGVWPECPDRVIELNRLWVHDSEPRNTESWFVSRCLRELPPLVVVSYADTSVGHFGYIYRALSWRYAGWTDMDRKTPRLDYIPADPSKHTREASRSGVVALVRRKPKVRYWTVTGSATDRRNLARSVRWPTLDWRTTPPPGEATP